MTEEIFEIAENDSDIHKNVLYLIKAIFLDLFMAFGPTLNYVFQVKKFKKTKSSKGFSNRVCLVTVLSHTLKVFFWFAKKFKYTLLVQSILVIAMQLYLIYLVIKFKDGGNEIKFSADKNCSKINKIKTIIKENLFNWSETLNRKLIWNWDNVVEYYKFYFIIILSLGIISLIFGMGNKFYSNIIGLTSIFLEMLCSLPQIIEMRKTKNQRNISKIMVLMWLNGNIIKIYYNTINHSPIQLIVGSYVQVFCNFILIGQIIYYYQINKLEQIDNFGEIKLVEQCENEQAEKNVEEKGQFELINSNNDIINI